MLNRRAVAIRDIYVDDRIPHDAYRPTFVHSLAMVPIRTLDPVGAIGIYWAEEHEPTEAELSLLRALADSTAVAMENVAVYQELEQRVRDRTEELEALNTALHTFSSRAAHDLRSPLATIKLALATLPREGLSEEKRSMLLETARAQTETALALIDDLLDLARASGIARRQPIVLRELLAEIQSECPEVDLRVGSVPETVDADPVTLRQALLNLVRNAGSYAATGDGAVVDVEAERVDGEQVFAVSDRGPGLLQELRANVFQPFERGREGSQPGTGLGLAIVGAMAESHGGRAWYEDRDGGGATFKVAIPSRPQ